MESDGIEVSLDVAIDWPRIRASLTFKNLAEEEGYLDRVQSGLSGVLENRLFEVTAGGEPIDYIGPRLKRSPSGPEDFLPIAPGAEARTTLELSEAYAFRPGTHLYRARYRTFQGHPVKPDLYLRVSNWVEFSYSR